MTMGAEGPPADGGPRSGQRGDDDPAAVLRRLRDVADRAGLDERSAQQLRAVAGQSDAILAWAQHAAAAMITDAEEAAAGLVQSAADEAKSVLVRASEEARVTVAAAERQSRQLLLQAQRRAAATVERAQARAARVTRRAIERYGEPRPGPAAGEEGKGTERAAERAEAAERFFAVVEAPERSSADAAPGDAPASRPTDGPQTR